MRAPEHWSRRSPLAYALAPLGLAWGLGSRLRQALGRPRTVPVPVVCVGNLTVGGAGKTPTALALAPMLRALGREPHFLTRGYGGRLPGPLRVDLGVHQAADVGDEPLLLAAEAPCWVARDRAAGAEAAVAAGAGAIVMDDGLQNPGLAKTLSFAVVDGATGFGNGFVLPAGPLREFVADGLARVQALVAIGPVAAATERMLDRVAGPRPVFGARFVPDVSGIAGRKVVAFAGIARPEKFFAGLRDAGCDLVAVRPFPDHHRFGAGEIAALRRQAEVEGALLATTAKDYARLPAAERAHVVKVDGRLLFDDSQAVADLVRTAIGRLRATG